MTELTLLPPPQEEMDARLRLLQIEPRIVKHRGTPLLAMPLIAMQFRVVGTNHYLWDSIAIIDQAAWRHRQFMRAIGTKRERERWDRQGWRFELELEGLIGRICSAHLVFRAPYQHWAVKTYKERT